MGLAKAALESASRGIALELGSLGITSNIVSPGPVDTLAGRGIPGFRDMLSNSQANSMRPQAALTQAEAGQVAASLAYPGMGAVTGQVLKVDCGASTIWEAAPTHACE